LFSTSPAQESALPFALPLSDVTAVAPPAEGATTASATDNSATPTTNPPTATSFLAKSASAPAPPEIVVAETPTDVVVDEVNS
jgi:hypothetical protein